MLAAQAATVAGRTPAAPLACGPSGAPSRSQQHASAPTCGWQHCSSGAIPHRSGNGSRLTPAAAGGSSSSSTAPSPEQLQQASNLLDWLVRWQGATPASPKVERRFAGEGLGWCLVATADIEPEEVSKSSPAQIPGGP